MPSRPGQGDIVLVPIPFTDLTSARRRPVIVLSNDEYNRATEDIIVVAMTSNLAPSPYSFVITSDRLEAGALNHPGRIRCDKIYTLSQHIVVKHFGKVKADVLDQIRTHVAALCR